LREMPANSPVMQHCLTCPDCSQLTTLLRDREYHAANVLNNLPPMSNPITVAETSVQMARRRRTGRVVVMLSGAALIATIWITAATIFFPAMRRGDLIANSSLRTETISLSCLSPQQAADIINPYVRSHGSTYYLPTSDISAITVRGTASEIAKSKELIDQFEPDAAAACHHTTGSDPNGMGSDLKVMHDQLIDAQGLGTGSGSGSGQGSNAPANRVEPKVRTARPDANEGKKATTPRKP
jgi:type II secretory pathway component GspD/PulD (secretin)